MGIYFTIFTLIVLPGVWLAAYWLIAKRMMHMSDDIDEIKRVLRLRRYDRDNQ